MTAARALLSGLISLSCLWAEDARQRAPSFSADSIVNSANNRADSLTPNTIATIYGSELAFSTRAVSAEDTRNGSLPSTLAGVRVLVGPLFASLIYVSPVQINFVVPCNLLPGQTSLRVHREGTLSAPATINLLETSPAVFLVDPVTIAATHVDGSLITPASPARAGEFVILYGTGFGPTNPQQIYERVPSSAASILRLSELRVFLDDSPLSSDRIAYAGITPGFPGLYQINLRLPDDLRKPPGLRIVLGDRTSQIALQLAVETAP